MRSFTFLTLILFALTACVREVELVDVDLPQKVMPGKLEAQCNSLYSTNKRGKRVSWKGHVPVVFTLDTAFPPEFVPYLQDAMNEYNEAAGYELFKIGGTVAGPILPQLDHQNRITFLKDGAEADAQREHLREELAKDHGIAVTHAFYTGNQIIDSDIVFDGKTQSLTNSRIRLGSYDFEKIALHELGHALGLAHNDEIMSVMWPFGIPIGIAIRTLDDTTKQMLECEYK